MIRIGILGAADIAKRRFLPALNNASEYELAGVASATNDERYAPLKELDALSEYREVDEDDRIKKVKSLCDEFGGKVYESYEELLMDESVDAVYIPLPPSLHYYWGKKALNANKHVYMEKPFTISYEKTRELIDMAEEKNLAVFENYGFTFNDQVKVIETLMKDSDRFGDLRLIRGYFGFPKRLDTDFRYNKKLGGGALLDCGGYCLRLARHLLGDDLTVLGASASQMPSHDVDGWGSVMLRSKSGVCAQLSFGMDNQYKCEAEIWGSIGTIHAPRIFTPPPQFEPKLALTTMNGTEYIEAKPEDAFLHGQKLFSKCIENIGDRDKEYWEILNQSKCFDEVERIMGI